MKVSDFLRTGAKSAQTAKRLTGLLHITRHDLSKMVQAERLAGVPICSSTATSDEQNAGYYLPENAGELEVVGYAKCGRYDRALLEMNQDFRLWDMNA